MNNFTLKNLFSFWREKWYVTLTFLILGLSVGAYLILSTEQTYQSTDKLLIINQSENLSPADYDAIITSPLFQTNLFNDLGIAGESCTLTSSTKTNIVTIISTCKTPEESESLAVTTAEHFSSTLNSVYPEDANLSIFTLSESPTAEAVTTTKDKIYQLAVPIFASLITSFIIIFIMFDIATNKKSKK